MQLERIKQLLAVKLWLGEPAVQVTATAAQLNAAGTLSGTTAAVADLNLLAGLAADGSTVKRVVKVPLNGTTIHGGVQSWLNPEAGAIIINRVTNDITTIATAVGTLSTGTTIVSGTTASQNLIDTLDCHTTTICTDNLQTPGSGGKQLQKLAAGGWVTFKEQSGNLTGMVGNCYIEYLLV